MMSEQRKSEGLNIFGKYRTTELNSRGTMNSIASSKKNDSMSNSESKKVTLALKKSPTREILQDK